MRFGSADGYDDVYAVGMLFNAADGADADSIELSHGVEHGVDYNAIVAQKRADLSFCRQFGGFKRARDACFELLDAQMMCDGFTNQVELISFIA